MLALVIVAVAVVRRSAVDDDSPSREEPLLPLIRLDLRPRERPVIGVVGLEPGTGASTIAYNLATLVAVEGRVRGDREAARPLPVCLLSEGELATRLGLTAGPVRDYLKRHPGDVGDDFMELVSHDGPWLDLLCVPADRVGRRQLSRTVAVLRRRYDAVVIACGTQDRFLTAALAEEADLLLVCIGQQGRPIPAPMVASANALLLGRESKAILVQNRQPAGADFDRVLPEFEYRVELPDDPEVRHVEAIGRPWVLWHGSAAGRRLNEIARAALPRLFQPEVDVDAA
ncbi:MAG: hypothetical protein ACR2MY_13695 [Candidatus Dormibacteria bacterium]